MAPTPGGYGRRHEADDQREHPIALRLARRLRRPLLIPRSEAVAREQDIAVAILPGSPCIPVDVDHEFLVRPKELLGMPIPRLAIKHIRNPQPRLFPLSRRMNRPRIHAQ